MKEKFNEIKHFVEKVKTNFLLKTRKNADFQYEFCSNSKIYLKIY